MSSPTLRSSFAGVAAAPVVPTASARQRTVWCDIAKGFAIILVVYYHASMGVLYDIPVDPWWERTLTLPMTYFRMPLFFFASGIFAAVSIRRDWWRFTDRTLLHLVYIFVLWNLLQLCIRTAMANYLNHPLDDPLHALMNIVVDPLDVTWFVEVLIIFYIALRILRDVPSSVVIAAGVVLAMLPEASNYVLERSQSLFLFFAAGAALSDRMQRVQWRPDLWLVVALVGAFAVCSLAFVHSDLDTNRSLILGLSCLGVVAAVSLAMWIAHYGKYFGWLLYIGRHTLPVFVMHITCAGATREVLLRTELISHPAPLIIASTVVGVIVPLGIYVLCEMLRFPWLFERPQQLHLSMPPVTTVPQSSEP